MEGPGDGLRAHCGTYKEVGVLRKIGLITLGLIAFGLLNVGVSDEVPVTWSALATLVLIAGCVVWSWWSNRQRHRKMYEPFNQR